MRLGGYDHGNGYDDDCSSTTATITTFAMVTIAAAMATIAEPMSECFGPALPLVGLEFPRMDNSIGHDKPP